MRLRMLQLPPTATATVFPEIDKLLEDLDYQKSLKYIARRKNMDRYRSMVDFLLCETIEEHRRPCFKFYDNEGPPFRDLFGEEERQRCEDVLKMMLFLCRDYMDEDRDKVRFWSKTRDRTLDLSEFMKV